MIIRQKNQDKRASLQKSKFLTPLLGAVATGAMLSACSTNETTSTTSTEAVEATSSATSAATTTNPDMSYFLTSVGSGDGANLGGLSGADAHCGALADEAGVTGKTWHAYLSTTGEGGVNAMDRIGSGPWMNANGVVVATSVANLLSDENNLTKETSISERGEIINGRGDKPNRHDILTGTTLNGTASSEEGDSTCENWTSNSPDGSAIVGHHDRTGGGANPTSWSSAHNSRGCSQENLQATGGDGLFYCFATK